MIEAILNEAEAVANSRNDEVVDWLLWRLEQQEIEEARCELRSQSCSHCWSKLKYVTFKVAAHRMKRRIEWADGTRYSNLCHEREQALKDAFFYRLQYKSQPCICAGRTYREIGKQFLCWQRVKKETHYA